MFDINLQTSTKSSDSAIASVKTSVQPGPVEAKAASTTWKYSKKSNFAFRGPELDTEPKLEMKKIFKTWQKVSLSFH